MVHVDQPFMVIPRFIDLPDSSGWVEDPDTLMHQRAFTDISEKGHGLAIFNRGLPAVEVTRGSDEVQVALPLLRSVGWLSRDDLPTRRVAAGPLAPTPGAQCLGDYHFDYGIYPHASDWHAVYIGAAGYNTPLLVGRADTHEGLNLSEMNITRDDPAMVKTIPWDRSGVLPGQASFFRIDHSELVLNSLHRAHDGQGLILRFYNISSDPINARLTSLLPIREAWRVNLNEEKIGKASVEGDHSCMLAANGCQVVTLRLNLTPTIDEWAIKG